jgi:hypothetical protein
MSLVGDSDSTGAITSATAGSRLVRAVLKVAPAMRKAYGRGKNSINTDVDTSEYTGGGELDVTGTSSRLPPPSQIVAGKPVSLAQQRVDPGRERKAYETVNYVLGTIGSRILEAGLVNVEALARALTAATSHIEVQLFSLETNRLFKSLAHKLNDVNLVNSAFTSIYFIGFLTAEIASSLPYYKREYPPLGPRIVQDIFRVAIGEDAFRENLTANLDAYKTLATTAGLLRPTDIGYSIFPGT